MRLSDPLIIGGGPAGAAAAITLAKAGAHPLVLERQRETGDAICGGFISWRTLQTLERLGVSAQSLGGHVIDHMLIATPRRAATARLPAPARGVSRRRLDTVLLAQAEAQGARVERGISVRALEGQRVRLGDGTTLVSESLFIATGKHELRGLGRAKPGAFTDPTAGLRLLIPSQTGLSRLIGSAIELHLFRGGYAGLQLREDGLANLCLAVRKSRLLEAGGDPRALLQSLGESSPLLGERLAYADFSQAPDSIAAIPYGWRARDTVAGQFRLGDQAAVIPSLAGEGNGMALASGIRAGDVWLRDGAQGAQAYQSAFARAAWLPLALAGAVRDAGERSVSAAAMVNLMRAAPALASVIAEHTRIGSS